MGVYRNSLRCKKNKLLCEASTPATKRAKLFIIINKQYFEKYFPHRQKQDDNKKILIILFKRWNEETYSSIVEVSCQLLISAMTDWKG